MKQLKTKKIKIKDLKVGMKIKTVKDGKIVFRDVIDVFNTEVAPEKQRLVEFENGTKLECSDNHPIMVSNGDVLFEVYPDNLSVNDSVVTDKGETKISSVQHNNTDVNYIDVTVEDTHTFFVADNQASDMILTHNCSQGGIRNASATFHYPIWHKDFSELIVLKNNQGTDETRVRHLDYCVVTSGYFLKRLKDGKNITFFDPNTYPDLYDAFYADPTGKFIELYEKYEKSNVSKKKVELSAESVWKQIIKERNDTGRIYLMFVDNVSQQGPYDTKIDPIYSSNLCVAPETKILTKSGYVEIKSVVDKEVDVWNGKEWSNVTVRKTGENQKLIRVTMNSGADIQCTPYHKFYIIDDSDMSNRKQKEVRAHELAPGNRLIKFDLPIIHGNLTLDYAYENGFYSGDGFNCLGKYQKLYFYGQKRKIIPYLADIFTSHNIDEKQDRECLTTQKLKDKYFVPDCEYTIESRMKWLAGILDSDGTVARNGKTESLQIGSIHKDFLLKIQLMLQGTGVSSKVTRCKDSEGVRLLPANDGTGNMKEYMCQQAYRLLIGQSGINLLKELGLKTLRLIIGNNIPNREATQFVKVVSVIDEGRFDDTYCFEEPKRHMGMFNGILTGQCQEILLSTRSFQNINDPDGRVALCTLGSLNIGKFKSPKELEKPTRLLTRGLVNVLNYQEFLFEMSKKHNDEYMPLGIGLTNVAYWFAKRGYKYGQPEALQELKVWMEHISYYSIKESVELAKIYGKCKKFDQTKWAKGIFPWELRKDGVNELADFTPSEDLDWEGLRKDVITYGMKNVNLLAVAPVESSSVVIGGTNGIEPAKELVIFKDSKTSGSLIQVVPEYEKLKDKYQLLYDIDCEDYLKTVAIISAFVDQSISTNTFYNPAMFGGNVPMQKAITDIMNAYNWGVKTLYYGLIKSTGNLEKMNQEEDCVACKL